MQFLEEQVTMEGLVRSQQDEESMNGVPHSTTQ